MTVYETIIWGVVTGIITSVIIFILGLFFTKILIPWYQGIIYGGIDLNGNWIQENTQNGITYQYHLLLKQKAHKLNGIMTLTKTGTEGNDYIQPFDVEGTTWEGYITLNLKSKDRKSLSYATTLLTINNLGNNMKGYLVYRARDNDEVNSEEIIWNRSK